jgi:hypothetical protein
MKKWLPLIFLVLLSAACKQKKKQLDPDAPVTIAGFFDFYPDTKLPLHVKDSAAFETEIDSIPITFKIFSGFVPDSLLGKYFGKNARPLLFPMARLKTKDQETYLLTKAIQGTKKGIFLSVFNKDKKYSNGMPLLITETGSEVQHTADMDAKFTITTNQQHKGADGLLLYKKAVYAYSPAATSFNLILTESNDQTAPALINPIDTLPAKNKLSGDYRRDKMNLVSIRDGKKPNQIRFFIHFEENGGDCKGELKGEASIIAPGKAVYRQSGDQCALQINFEGNRVSLKEEEACGSHRDIKCFFEGSFIKKPSIKIKTGVKKK